MVRACIALVAAAGRQTGDAERAPWASQAQASIDAFFDGDSSVFSLERSGEAMGQGMGVEDEAPESGSQPTAIPLAPAA